MIRHESGVIRVNFDLQTLGATLSGTRQLWQPIQLAIDGPETHELAVSPNPFLDIRLDVTLISPSGDSRVVPGFFAGDGDAALTGGHEQDQVFELSGQTHLLYLQDGHEERQLSLPAGRYDMQWFDPRNGQFLQDSQSIEGGTLSIPEAPGDADEDWAVLIASDSETTLPTPEVPTETTVDTPGKSPELGNAEPETPLSVNNGRLDLALMSLFLAVLISRLTTGIKRPQ